MSTPLSPATKVGAPTDSTTPPPRPALRVQSVLASGLPAEVGTPHEPSLYTVPAVFSRRVTPEERSRIEDPATAEDLMATTGAGPGLALAVSDRRLLIVNTNLAQLKDGLAMAIGRMLSRLDEDLLTEQDERDAAAELLLASEVDRASAVAETAAQIRFDADEDGTDSAR